MSQVLQFQYELLLPSPCLHLTSNCDQMIPHIDQMNSHILKGITFKQKDINSFKKYHYDEMNSHFCKYNCDQMNSHIFKGTTFNNQDLLGGRSLKLWPKTCIPQNTNPWTRASHLFDTFINNTNPWNLHPPFLVLIEGLTH